MINISKEEISDKMFFIREENSNQPIAVVKVGDLMKFDRPQSEWVYDTEHSITMDMYKCSVCGYYGHTHFNFCPNCGAEMKGSEGNEID